MNLLALQYLALTSQVVPAVASIVYARILSRQMRIFSYYLLSSLLSSLVNTYLALHDIHNLWLGNAFMLVEFGLLAYFFSSYLADRWRRIALWSIPCFAAFLAVDFLFLESLFGLSTIARPVEGAVLTLLSTFALLTIYSKSVTSFTSEPLYWIASAAILYFASTAILFSMSGTLMKMGIESLKLALTAEAIINIITNLLFTGGILCFRRLQTSSGQRS